MHSARILEIKNKDNLVEELKELGVTKTGIKIMSSKSQFYLIKLKQVPLKAALIYFSSTQ
jgi:dihydropteroate synthase